MSPTTAIPFSTSISDGLPTRVRSPRASPRCRASSIMAPSSRWPTRCTSVSRRARESCAAPSELYRVAQARERKARRLDPGHDAVAGAHRGCHPQHIAQHDGRALVEAEVHDRRRDLAVLDEPQSVAREPGLLHRLRIDGTDVPEMRDQNAALGGCDERLDALGAAIQNDAADGRRGLAVRLLRPVAIVRERLQHAFFDPCDGTRRDRLCATATETTTTTATPSAA